MVELTAFQQNILALLANRDEEVYGLELKRDLEDHYDTDVNHGRLYPNLTDMAEEMGLLEIGSIDDRTNSYSITEKGEEVLHEKIDWMLEETGRA